MSDLIVPAPWVRHDGGRAEAGYKGDAGDCVTRAIAIALDLPYQTVYDHLAEKMEGRVYRGKKRPRSARNGVAKAVYHPYLLDQGWEWVPTMHIGQTKRVHVRAGEMPPGRAVLRLSKHLCASVDGVVWDTYDPGRDGTRLIYGYYRPAVSSVDATPPLPRVRADERPAALVRPETI